MSCDKDDQESASNGDHRPHLHLVAHPQKEKSAIALSEAAATELRGLIHSLQEKEPRAMGKPSNEDLPPAA